MYENTDIHIEKEIKLLLIIKKILATHGYAFYDVIEEHKDSNKTCPVTPRRYGYKNTINDKEEISKFLCIESINADIVSKSGVIWTLFDLLSEIFKGLRVSFRARINNPSILNSSRCSTKLIKEIRASNEITAEMIKHHLGQDAMLAIASQRPEALYKVFSDKMLVIKHLEEIKTYLPNVIGKLIDTDMALGVLSEAKNFCLDVSVFYDKTGEILASGDELNGRLMISVDIDSILSILDELQTQQREDIGCTLVIASDTRTYSAALAKVTKLRNKGCSIILTLDQQGHYHAEHFRNILKVTYKGSGRADVEIKKGENILQ